MGVTTSRRGPLRPSLVPELLKRLHVGRRWVKDHVSSFEGWMEGQLRPISWGKPGFLDVFFRPRILPETSENHRKPGRNDAKRHIFSPRRPKSPGRLEIIAFLGVLVTDVSTVIGLVGAICGSAIIYVIPCLLFDRASSKFLGPSPRSALKAATRRG